VVRIIYARSNTAAEHPLTLVVMTLAYRDDRTRGLAVVAREGSSRSTVFHRLHCTCKLYKIRDRRVRPSGSAVFVHRVARCSLPWAIEHRWPPEISAKNTDRGGHFQRKRWGKSRWRVFKWRFPAGCTVSFEPLVGFKNNFAQMSSMMRRCAVPMFDQGRFKVKVTI